MYIIEWSLSFLTPSRCLTEQSFFPLARSFWRHPRRTADGAAKRRLNDTEIHSGEGEEPKGAMDRKSHSVVNRRRTFVERGSIFYCEKRTERERKNFAKWWMRIDRAKKGIKDCVIIQCPSLFYLHWRHCVCLFVWCAFFPRQAKVWQLNNNEATLFVFFLFFGSFFLLVLW